MDNKFYVSYEAARLLKEKGYNEVCNTAYDNEGIIGIPPTKCNNTKLAALSFVFGDDCYSAPSKAEAIDWLESKGIVVQTIPSTPNIWRWRMSSMKYIPYDDNTEDSEMLYKTRLEAEEAAIIKALTLL